MRRIFVIAALVILSITSDPEVARCTDAAASRVPSLDALLGFPLGSRPASYEEILRSLEAIASSSPRVELERAGTTHEGRPIIRAIVASETTLARLDDVRAALDELAGGTFRDPSAHSSGPGVDPPLVVWVGGAIHGDEPSGGDAALAIVHRFAADTTAEGRALLDRVLLVVCPVLNPDGRGRFTADLTQWSSRVPSEDEQSLHHRAPWPTGRGNHYLLDLNRDWFALSQPETRAGVEGLLRWRPHVVLDLHEMRSFDTFLMSPPREPHNPNLPPHVQRWWSRFAFEQASRFGERGWSCYSRDWHEEFNPNRGASWPLFTGAIAILQEQSGVDGTSMRTPAGGSLTYGEAVDHHVVAALAVIESAGRDRAEILRDYAGARRQGRTPSEGQPRWFAIDDTAHPDQVRRLLDTLLRQGIAIRKSTRAIRVSGARDIWGAARGGTDFPAGTYIVDTSEGEGRLARAILDFDPELDADFVALERGRIESGQPTLLYEAPAWSMAMAYGVGVHACADPLDLPSERVAALPPPVGDVVRPDATYGFVLDAAGAGAVPAMADLLESGVKAWAASEPFTVAGIVHGPGSVVIRRAENGADLVDRLRIAVRRTGATFRGVDHALVDAGADLGSRAFSLLRAPRVAILSGRSFYATTFGALWHFLDVELDLGASLLSPSSLARSDLDRYNTIIVPDGESGSGLAVIQEIGSAGFAALESWVQRGGTLITTGEGAWVLFGAERPLCSLRDRRQVLAELPSYAPGAVPIAEEEDARLRRFSPQGAILRVDLDPRQWLSAGVGDRVAFMLKSDLCLLAKQPAERVGAFADSAGIRMSGLLWPEARHRLSHTIAVGREPVGRGQVIAFMGNPYYRAYFHGSARLLANALLLGPGMGTSGSGPGR